MLPLMFLSEWLFKLSTVAQSNFQVNIAMVGKYTGLSDSYLSVLKVTFFKVQMHTCTCNDDNNILTHEVAVDHLIAI